jgi:hypothetical protein
MTQKTYLTTFIMCLLAGTGAVFIGGNQWAFLTLVAVIVITIASTILRIRHDKAFNIPITSLGIVGNFISNFLLHSFISFSIAFATLLIYNAL